MPGRKPALAVPAEKCPVPPTWFGVIVTLVGLWYLLADLKALPTFGISLWSLVVLLIGIYLWNISVR